MLSRVLARPLQAPTRIHAASYKVHPASFRIATSPVWIRSMAHNNKPAQGQNPRPNKPTVYVKQGSSQQPGSAASAFGNNQKLGGSSNQKAGKDFSKRQDEFNSSASPARNTMPQPEGLGSKKTSNEGRQEAAAADFSSKQDEFDTSASPSENTAPQSTSPSALDPAEAREQAEAQEQAEDVPNQNQPLPDLTQGIPPTIEYELANASKSGGLNLNLTEAESSSTGGRGKGELPASAYISSSEKKRIRLANYLYAFIATLCITGTVYLGRNWETEEEEKKHPEAPSGWGFGLMWKRSKARLSDQLNFYKDPAFQKLLPDPDPMFERPYTLVLGMEDVLLHSEWTREHGWRMAKRPGLDYFLRYLSQYYELVVWTPQPSALGDPVVRKLDPYHIITWPLYREATLYENGEYIKDLSYLNRDLSKVIMIDTNPSHSSHQPENAIILPPWHGDPHDNVLISLIPFLEYIHTMTYTDVRKALVSFSGTYIPIEFARRESVARQKFLTQLSAENAKKPKRAGVGKLGELLGIKSNAMMVMSDPSEMTPAEAFAQGKMLQDQARERGQKNYEMLEREIRENGPKWLEEERRNEERMNEEAMRGMRSGFVGWFGRGEKEMKEGEKEGKEGGKEGEKK